MPLLQELNTRYLDLHVPKEDSFWSSKMGLKSAAPGEFENHELALKAFISDQNWLPKIREDLKRQDLTDVERVGLRGWLRFFEVNVVESEDAKRLQRELVEMEGELDRVRRKMKLGYTDPKSKEFVEASSGKLSLMIATHADEAFRKAAWVGMRSIENYVLDNGYLPIVKKRNELGRLMGFEDYYDYKVNLFEGFSKRKLFEILDELERDTRTSVQSAVDQVQREKGLSSGRGSNVDAREPWNFGFLTSGDLTARRDPYFQFSSALGRWGASFNALGIRYHGATLKLDLVNRPGKYENGFMHGPQPSWMEGGTHHPARIGFTANAVLGSVGSGIGALQTLFHEGGHAAHFSNIFMPSPCFGQEFAPTSVAFAETQSMFLDSLIGDSDWCARYARNEKGESMPVEIMEEGVELSHRLAAFRIRSLLVVPYAEKAIYELKDSELNAESVLARIRETERKLVPLTSSARPVLSVPHLLSGESSAYYHGYVLAQMAVHQTRAYFLEKFGSILDNPKVGEELGEKYWKPGNSKTFLELVQDLTGKPFSAAATVALVNRTLEEAKGQSARMLEKEKSLPRSTRPIELDARIELVHGDEVIASNLNGQSFEELDHQFSSWVRSQAASA